MRESGFHLLCAADAFVHHFGETSFGKLVASGEYARVLKVNQARFEEKWQEPWRPYKRRQSSRYRELTERIRQSVLETVPADATVLIVNPGDDELLADRRPLPRGTSPAPTTVRMPVTTPPTAATQSRGLRPERARGADYIVFPATGSWWLEHYEGLRQHLDKRYDLSSPLNPESCVIFHLAGDPT